MNYTARQVGRIRNFASQDTFFGAFRGPAFGACWHFIRLSSVSSPAQSLVHPIAFSTDAAMAA
jgi:hypothetical protein